MNFSNIIKSNLNPLLQSYGFTIIEEKENLIDFQSSNLLIRFYYSPNERLCGYFLKHKDYPNEYNNEILEDYLSIDKAVYFVNSNQKIESWVNKISNYFIENKHSFLSGSIKFFSQLDIFFHQTITNYNKNLQLRELKNLIGIYWKDKDYSRLAKLKESNLMGLAESDMKKIEFAEKKVNKST